MRICLVARESVPGAGGGIGTGVREMSRVLARAGHDVTLLTQGPAQASPEGEVTDGVRVQHVDVHRGRAAINAYGSFNARWSMAVLEHLLAQPAFDVVEFPDYQGQGYFSLRAKRTGRAFERTLLAVRLHASAALCRVHDETDLLDLDLVHTEHMELASVNEADLLLHASEAALTMTRDLARARGLWQEDTAWGRRTALLAFPVTLPGAPATGGEDDAGWRTVLYFGRLQRLKGVDTLVRAARRVLDELGPAARVRFVLLGGDTPHTGRGGGDMSAELRALIGPERERIVLRDGVARESLVRAIDAAEVVCLPSRLETFSCAAVEAMARGKALIVTAGGSLPEVVEHGVSGLVTAVDDDAALAREILRLLGDASLRAMLGERAAARAAHYADAETFVRGFERATAPSEKAPAPARAAAGAKPRVCVMIPFYNLEAYLPETLASIAAQRERDFEVVIVDDGSTSPGARTLLEQVERDPAAFVGPCAGLRIVRKENGGLASARNAGFGASRAPWVLMLDADDLIAPEYLERALRVTELDDGLAYVSTFARFFYTREGDHNWGWTPLGIDPDMQPALNLAGCSCSLVRVEAWKQAGGFDEWMTTFEDWEFWCRIAAAGLRGSIIPEFLFLYRTREASMYRAASEQSRLANRARILARHLPRTRDPSRGARFLDWKALTGDEVGAGHPVLERRVRSVIEENIRYRAADRVNGLLGSLGVRRAMKRVLRAVRG
ncbi:MAG: glycosyltransferase [Planctomycetota bacterium]|nr:glycosyltransferase [Planctomycetota bacterium]